MGPGLISHLANGALYTQVHDYEPGGAGFVVLQSQSVSPLMLDGSLVVLPQLDNTSGGGSLTFTDSNGDSMNVTAAGTYQLNWGPITSFTITPNNLLASLDQRGYVDSISVARRCPRRRTSSPVVSTDAGIAHPKSAGRPRPFKMQLLHPASEPPRHPGQYDSGLDDPNWGDGSAACRRLTGDPSSVTHVYTTGSETFNITATATGTKTVTSSLTNHAVTYVEFRPGGFKNIAHSSSGYAHQ